MNGWLDAFIPFIATVRSPAPANLIPSVWIFLELLFAAAMYVRLRHRARKLLTSLGDMDAQLARLQPDQLSATFEDVSDRLSADTILGSDWSRFAQTVHREASGEGDVRLFRTADAQDVYSNGAAGDHLNLRFYGAVPGLLTSLGILGTFVGLTYGLAQVQGTFGDTLALKQGIQDLLKGAAIAFSTSVWGIALSFGFSVFEKRRTGLVARQLGAAQAAINHAIPRRNSEAWLSAITQESGQQTRELKRFNTDLATSIAQALDERIAARVTPALEMLVGAVEGLQEHKQESSIAAIEQLAKEFSDRLSQGSSESVQELNSLLTGVNSTLARTLQQSQESQERLETSLKAHLGGLSSNMDRVLSALSESHSRLQESTGKGLEEMLGKIQEAIGVQQKAFSDATSAMQGELQGQIARMVDAVGGLVRDVGASAQQNTDFTTQKMERLADMLETRIGETSEQLSEERDKMERLASGINGLLGRLEDVTTGIALAGESLRDAASPIERSTGALSTSLAQLQAAQSQVADLVSQSERTAAEHLASIDKSAEFILQSLESTERSWTAYGDRFEGLRDDLGGLLEELSRGVTAYTQRTRESISTYLKDLDDHLAAAAGTLGAATEGLREVVDDLNDQRRRP